MHSSAATPTDTDWLQVVALYDQILFVSPTPIVELNRALAIAAYDDAIVLSDNEPERTLLRLQSNECLAGWSDSTRSNGPPPPSTAER